MIIEIGTNINKYELIINKLYAVVGCVPFHNYKCFCIVSSILTNHEYRIVYYKNIECELITIIEKVSDNIWKCSIPSIPFLYNGKLIPFNLNMLFKVIINELKIRAIYFPLIYNRDNLYEIFKSVSDSKTWQRLPSPIISWNKTKSAFWEKIVDRYGYNANRKKRIFERDLSLRKVNKYDASLVLNYVEKNTWKFKCKQDMLNQGLQFKYYTSLIESEIATLFAAFDKKNNCPLAYRIDSICKNNLFILKWSYSEEYKKYSPGFYLLSVGLLDYYYNSDLLTIDLFGSPDNLKKILEDDRIFRFDFAFPLNSEIENLKQERLYHDTRCSENFKQGNSIKKIYL